VNLDGLLPLPHLEEDLARLEHALRRTVAVGDPLLSEVATHLIAAGGKRLRPTLTLAAAAFGGGRATEEVLLGGAAVELVHLASLYHDDVMDEAPTRRSTESVNARWGNLVAIVAGDFLLARSAGVAASLGNDVSALLAATLGRMCQGQISEVSTAYNPQRSPERYLATIADKTASLMSASCRVGALLCGVEGVRREALTRFGECFGMVFQIRDDILDVVGTAEELGKPPGQDLVEGVYTLPVLRALADPQAATELRPLLGRRLDGPEQAKAAAIVAGSGGVASAAQEARRWATKAEEVAASLGRAELAQALGRLGHVLVDSLPI
jgi:heptaprenyl diphosphate synthase